MEEIVKEFSLNELGDEIVKINKDNGWDITRPDDWADSPHKIPAVLALIHSEVSEALEDFRNDNRVHFGEELADIIIRTLDLARGLGVDIEIEVWEKMEKNRGRGHRHGGKRV